MIFQTSKGGSKRCDSDDVWLVALAVPGCCGLGCQHTRCHSAFTKQHVEAKVMQAAPWEKHVHKCMHHNLFAHEAGHLQLIIRVPCNFKTPFKLPLVVPSCAAMEASNQRCTSAEGVTTP